MFCLIINLTMWMVYLLFCVCGKRVFVRKTIHREKVTKSQKKLVTFHCFHWRIFPWWGDFLSLSFSLCHCKSSLELVSAFFIKFLFHHQMIAFQKLWKMLLISFKKLFSFSRYSSLCSFSPSFPHSADSKGQMEFE